METVIRNGRIIDPVDGEKTGNIGIDGGKIVQITSSEISGENIIDADGSVVSPGFIDIHMHEEPLINGSIEYDIMNYMTAMGVTTAVGGNCGIGHADVIEYSRVRNRIGGPCNYIGLVGTATVRDLIGCNDKYKHAGKDQILKITDYLKDQFDKGAFGVSVGLEYVPGTTTEELFEICKAAAGYEDRIVSCHYRYDADRSLEALAEMIIASRESEAKFQVSHIGSLTAFGYMGSCLQMLDTARDAGVNIYADVYPYNSFCTYLDSAVFDPGCLERWNKEYHDLQIADGEYAGQRCTKELYEKLRKEKAHVLIIAYVMEESEVIKAMTHPQVILASDGLLSNGEGHPRASGTFPRILGKYVRDEQKLDLITAIDKMTRMPAERLGLKTKGRIKENYDADITIFDSDIIEDQSTYENSKLIPRGIKHVIVDGKTVFENQKLTGHMPGKALLFEDR